MGNFAIIVAGGRGTRMENHIPKQFIKLGKIPILMRSIHAFHRTEIQPVIVVVLPPDLEDEWVSLCHKQHFHVPHWIVHGGESRFQSVRNGLRLIADDFLKRPGAQESSYIAVHDAARPLIDPQLIQLSYQKARKYGAVALGLESTDSIRLIDDQDPMKNESIPRQRIIRMQTPQTFRASLLINGFDQEERETFTDEATVIETLGHPITLLKGDPKNIKITHQDDLRAASLFI